MRVITLSDLHLGQEAWGEFGIKKAKEAAKLDGDVLLFCGDLAEPEKDYFEQGLELLAKSSTKHKFFVLGNNDLEQLKESVLTEHYCEMRKRVGIYGFHLLDYEPYVVGDTGFVGNVGGYDGTLWEKYPEETKYANTAEEITKKVDDFFVNKEYKGRVPPDFGFKQLFNHCDARIEEHLDQIESCVDKIVLAIHHVCNKSFVKADNPWFAYLNWNMGSEIFARHYQRDKVVLGLCGHTHRSESYKVGKIMVHNVGGSDQPHVFDI